MKGVIEMKFNKILCYILSLIMLVSAVLPVYADETADEAATTETATTETATTEGAAAAEESDDDETAVDLNQFLNAKYVDAQARFDAMKEPYTLSNGKTDAEPYVSFENDKYEICVYEPTGEVAFRDKTTGQIILSNPHNVSETKAAKEIKANLLSQIMLTYSDNTGAKVSFNSFSDAAGNAQITAKRTRQGIRVEYTLGKEQAKYLVPRQISRDSFEQNILAPYKDKESRGYEKVIAYYSLQDPESPNVTSTMLTSMNVQWPITKKMAIYVLDSGVSNRELEELEGYIKNNTDYTFEKMADDYNIVEYVDTSAAPAIFRFAIEYTLDEHGIKVTLPANSIKYDTSNYRLENVKFLPYLGAGYNENEGFTLVPDGSGTVTKFSDIKDKAFIITGKLYGRDYAFHTVSGYTQETMRIPAFGVMQDTPVVVPEEEVETDVVDETTETDVENADGKENTDVVENLDAVDENVQGEEPAEGEVIEGEEPVDEELVEEEPEEAVVSTVRNGFVAYLEEGDAMAEISADHGGTVHPFSSTYCTFYPKPVDTYALTGISSSGDATYTIYSDRRYTGNYTLRIFPIQEEDADYTEMAREIREYLTDSGVLSKMDASKDSSDDVSLYLENFGTIETQQKVLGFPVQKQTPMTTFAQTKEMLEELSEAGIKNVDVKLTGWYNGGMEKTAPAKLKVEKVLGGDDGLQELSSYAKKNNVGIYPDIEFTYVGEFANFDGFSSKKDSVKTIDGRSSTHRVYNALYQGFEDDEQLIISPDAMTRFYDNISDDFKELGTTGISVGTLGYDLNSDHNEDFMLNREDAKVMIAEFLGDIKKDTGSVMIDGGNAYALKYADHVLDVPLDSSMNINTSMSVPFMGMVLHGSTEFAGTPINLDGDYEYSMLKAIENGANLYYMVSMENTSNLKTFPEFNKYYAVGYQNWKDDIKADYGVFNEAMKQVKYSYISDHEYLATRVVRVAYDNGTEFILNYNTHDVTLDDGRTVEAMSFIN